MTESAINKSESTPATPVPTAAETGQPVTAVGSYRYVQDQKKKDLMMPRRFCTFDTMAEDDAVSAGLTVTNNHVVGAIYNGQFVANKQGGKASALAAEFLNYNIKCMSGQGTWLHAAMNAATDLKYGFSLQNIVLKKQEYGEYKGMSTLHKLSPRDQKSVYAWVLDKNRREVLGFIQNPNVKGGNLGFKGNIYQAPQFNTVTIDNSKYPVIRNKNLLHYTYNTTLNNPQGDSPLVHCYQAWLEKKMVEEYELIGVSKDMGGLPVLKVPGELIIKANDPDNQFPKEKEAYNILQSQIKELHAGRQSYIVLTSDVYPGSTQPQYDLDFKGIDGGGKQYKTSEILDQKKKAIYNVFGAGYLLLGQDSMGSYNLSSTGASTHGFYVENNVRQKVDVINNQLAPRLLAANNIYLGWKDMPEFVHADPNQLDPDTLSKAVQRMKSVGGLTPSALKHYYKIAGLPVEGIEDLDFTNKGSSRAGEGEGTSGTGNSSDSVDTSTSNTENSVSKALIVDKGADGTIYAVDPETDKPINIQFINHEDFE